jgi:hypothetical protein
MGVREGVAAAAIVADRMRRALRPFWLSNDSIAIRQDERAVPEDPRLRVATRRADQSQSTIRVSSGCPKELEDRQPGRVAGNPTIGVERVVGPPFGREHPHWNAEGGGLLRLSGLTERA